MCTLEGVRDMLTVEVTLHLYALNHLYIIHTYSVDLICSKKRLLEVVCKDVFEFCLVILLLTCSLSDS